MGTASAEGISKEENLGCLMTPSVQSCQLEKLNIYVGPQSVEPGETIYIAVETVNSGGGSATAKSVIIFNELTGKEHSAKVKNGLAYLQIEAPKQTGRLTFHAVNSAIKSQSAEVLVHAAKPGKFDLRLEKDKNQIFVNSSLLSDSFGNLVEDGQSAQIEVRAENRLLATSQAHTENARLSFRLNCADLYEDNLTLTIRIRGALTQTVIPSFYCKKITL